MRRLERSLQFHFAVLTAIGGLMLASGEVGAMLPIVAVAAAAVSFLLVDLLKLFYLPTPAAYVGMGLVAIYCMGDFFLVQQENQLTAVAELLVWVEAVLLFQRKSARVFEQIGIFCLLELVVAAVFNHALAFGLLLVPFAIVGLRALVLLHVFSTAHAADGHSDGLIRTSTGDSAQAVAIRGIRTPRWAIVILGPAALLVAAVFFYALPRVPGASEAGQVGGRPTTGFSKSMTLDQVGELLQNDELVMRLAMRNQDTGDVYRSLGPIYIRGTVLEQYGSSEGVGIWNAVRPYQHASDGPLPLAYRPPESAEQNFDRVEVRVDAQPLTSDSLFAIAPYHRLSRDAWQEQSWSQSATASEPVVHRPRHWLLTRAESIGLWAPGRVAYSFGTHAFRHGHQTRFLRVLEPNEMGLPGADEARRMRQRYRPNHERASYRRMLEFSPARMPQLAAEAHQIAAGLGTDAGEPYQLAAAIERYLAIDGGFQYTLSLTDRRGMQVDPIERFVATSRRGHCQYFASAMVMMLRSQNIPARIVLGYKTDEYNPIGGHYVVRQLHAHAWVEVLLDEQDLPESADLDGQPTVGPVLVRFDPTPGSEQAPPGISRPGQFYDFAESLWSSYVLDMNGERQSQDIFHQRGEGEMSSAYAQMLSELKETVSDGLDDETTANWLAFVYRFSWRAAVLSIITALIATGLYWMGWPRWIPRAWPSRRAPRRATSRSSVGFYQQLCQLLGEAGLHRASGQTPWEFAELAAERLEGAGPPLAAAAGVATHAPGQPQQTGSGPPEYGPPEYGPQDLREWPVGRLVDLFYRVRYGGTAVSETQIREVIRPALDQIEDLVHRSAERSPRRVPAADRS